jgi:hypothetical protein
MEKKRNNLLLVPVIFGAAFVVGAIIFWVWFIRDISTDVSFSTGLKNIFKIEDKKQALILIGMILLMIIIPLSFIFNLIGWIKGNNKHTLIAGILYIFSLNLISAPLCIIEYFDDKRKIKNKLLFYTMIYTLIFNVMLIVLGISISKEDKSFDSSGGPFFIYMISAISVGLILNFIAWKASNDKAKIIAGIFYVLGISTIISAVICIISGKDFLKAIKNKLLFYAMVITFIISAASIAIGIGVGIGDSLPFWIYAISAIIAGLVLNFFAWKTSNDKVKVIAGIVYILGMFNIISGVLCIISGKDFLKAIKNKLLFYAMVFTFVISAILIAMAVGIEGGIYLLYFISAAIVGLILNFIAWKTNNKKAKIISGIVYILGIFTVISAILCFISCKDNRKLMKDDEKASSSVAV